MLLELKIPKATNPRQNANFLSLITHAYILPIFLKGYKRNLTYEDIPETLTKLSSKELGKKLERLWLKEKGLKSPSLFRVLIRMFGSEFFILGLVLMFSELVIRTAIALALINLISLHERINENTSQRGLYLCVSIIVGGSLVNAGFRHFHMLNAVLLGMKMRIACSSLIYRKILKLSTAVFGSTPVGQVTNLLSNDASKFEEMIIHAHSIYIGPIQLMLYSFIMHNLLGIWPLSGVLFMIALVPLQVFLGKKAATIRSRIALKTDDRIRLMNEMIIGIQVIKMYAWEKPLRQLVSAVRRLEVQQVRLASYIMGLPLVFLWVPKLATFVALITYVVSENVITAKYAFFTTALFTNLRDSMTIHFPFGLIRLGEFKVTLKRIENFLMFEEVQKSDNCISETKHSSKISPNTAVDLQNATAKWSCLSPSTAIQDVNVSLEAGTFVAIIGPVGSGKSTLLHIILKELPLLEGSLKTFGNISYASQEPWIFNGTVQQNILFGRALETKRYDEVIRVCALEHDINILPQGDDTLVGERGVMLSGGQRARLSLARAIYADADVYLLDDPLSAVDTVVGKQLYEKCILGFLQNKCRIFVTHQLQYLQEVDKIILVEGSKISLSGTFAEMLTCGLDFTKLLQKSNETQLGKEEASCQGNIESFSERHPVNNKIAYNEYLNIRKLQSKVYFNYIKLGGSWGFAALILLVLFCMQFLSSGADYFVAYWAKVERNEEAADSYANKIFSIPRDACIYVFPGLMLLLLLFSLLQIHIFFKYFSKVSVTLHDKMFSSVMSAPMKFFNTNPSGRILNRFAKDIGMADVAVPNLLLNTIEYAFITFGVIVVVSLTNVWLLLPVVVLAPVLCFMRSVYLRTSQSLKRLEGISKSH